MSRQFDGWKVVLTNMEGRVITAIGGCAILAGVAYIFQGETKTKRTKSGLFPGLVNLGNTCYFNSVLQALASVSTFVSWLNSCNLEQNDKGKILTTELSKLMQILNNPCYEQETYDPVLIFKSLCFHGWVITTDQQDAHELFQVITSTLADEVQELTSTKNWNSFLNDKVGVSDDSIVHRSRATASKIERKTCSPFTGLFANELSCKVCHKKYPVKFDHFDTISLSLPSRPFQFGSYTLQDLMKNFVCSEILESFECVSCNLENDGRRKEQKRFLKKLSLGKLPHCLCFHINRTYWQNNGTPYKNNTFVQFSETLNIHPYLYTSCDVNSKVTIPANFQVMSKTWLNNVRNPLQKDQPDDGMKTLVNTRLSLNTQYHLVAVIVHLGGVHNGHFITYRKLSCSGSGNVWTLVSDERVQNVSLPQVLKSNAYMLFYERNIE